MRLRLNLAGRSERFYYSMSYKARQKKALDDEQGIFSYDSDRQEVIDVLEAEIKRIRSELTRAKKDGGKKK